MKEYEYERPKQIIWYPFPLEDKSLDFAQKRIAEDSFRWNRLSSQAQFDLGRMRKLHPALHSYVHRDTYEEVSDDVHSHLAYGIGALFTYSALRQEASKERKGVLPQLLPGVVTTYNAAVLDRTAGIITLKGDTDIHVDEPEDMQFRLRIAIVTKYRNPEDITAFQYGAEDVYNIFQLNNLVRRVSGLVGPEVEPGSNLL